MSTKTMRPPPRRVLTTNKRKEREGFDSLKSSPPSSPTPTPTKLPKPTTPQAGSGKLSEPVSFNQILAGYLAHEYLSKGTIYGQPFGPSEGGEEEEAEPSEGNYKRYVEVSSLLKADGAHLPGVVNPSQLSRFLQM
ncbi:hypothetical protein P3X46_011778 [Hevea brasiliensis]|uniref:LisH domain-containing protein n=1 Tax=Hevea brasiliensis TaxID=3981 RepID=A0ABQ9MC54_HEVBR|nr:uncharacterized protein LOC110651129 [Hevea brasiliensis]KAJ9176469.1 hypothetical protein P3X46_011778 [Hevea brasiliensis]